MFDFNQTNVDWTKAKNNGFLPIDENIYLNRLKEQYKEHKKAQKIFHGVEQMKYKIRYQAMRLFCLDTQLISFNDVEIMESEVNQSF